MTPPTASRPRGPARPGGRVGLALAGLGLLAVAVHAPALGADWVHDDVPQIRDNPLLRDLRLLPTLWTTGVWAGAGSGSSFFRPLFTSSLALDGAVLGLTPAALHATQLAQFAALAAALAVVVRHLGGAAGAGLVAGALFAVHPVNVEAAAWVSARPELLQALFGLAALALHDAALRAPPRRALGLALGAAGALFLALGAKESALAFGAGLLALDVVRGAPFAPAALARRWAPYAAAALAYAVLRHRALGGVSGGLLGAMDPLQALGAAGQGALRLLWPVGLSISPPPPTAAHAVLGAVVLVLGAAVLWRGLRARSGALVPAALGLASLALGAGAAARIGEMADRYLLVPCAAACWGVGLGVAALPARPRRAAGALLLALGAAAALGAWRHTTVFQSNERLWSAAWARWPGSVRPPLNLAAVRLEAGDPHGALLWLERAEALAPGDPQVALNRANALQQLGDLAGAERVLRALVARDPGAGSAHLALAHVLLERGADGEAAGVYEEIVARAPGWAEAWAGLAVAEARRGRAEAARRAAGRALALDPRVQNAPVLRRLADGGAR